MKAEAEANADSDKAEMERIESMNKADAAIFQTESQLKEYDEKISDGNKLNIVHALGELKKAHEEKDVDSFEMHIDNLNAAWESASGEMYAQNESAEPAQEPASDSAEDVEFEEVKE